MKPLINLLNNSFFNYLLLGFALLYSLVFIFFGIDFTDSFYYINLCENYASSPMLVLTLLIGKGWIMLFGDTLLSFRVLNWIVWTLSFLLPFFILVPLDSRKENLKYVSISIFLSPILNFNVFGADGCTLFFLTLSASLIIKFYRTNKFMHLLMYGLLSSFLILVRFPNIMILPATVVLFSIMEFNRNNQKMQKGKIVISFFKKLLIYFALSSGFYALIIMIIYGNLTEFTSKLAFSILNVEESHTIITMVKIYLKHFVELLQYIGICFLIFVIIHNRLNFNLLIHRTLTIMVIALLMLFLKVEIGTGKYNLNLSILFSAIVSSIIILYSYFNIQNSRYNNLIIISVVLIFAVIPVTGSTTGLFKLSPFLTAFLPILIASNQKVFNWKSQLSYLFVVFFLFTIYAKMMVVYEDSNIASLRYEFKIEKLNHINTTKANVQFIDNVLNEFKEFEKENKTVLFYGKVSHVFYYLTNTKPLYQISFWMPPYDLKEVKQVEQIIIRKRPNVIFVPSYPENSIQYFNSRKTLSPFEEMLIENGYNSNAKNSFILYNP